MTAVEIEKALGMVRAALAEAGYPDVKVWEARRIVHYDFGSMPHAVAWRAGALVALGLRTRTACWPCWVASGYTVAAARSCTHDTWDGAPPVVRPAVSA